MDENEEVEEKKEKKIIFNGRGRQPLYDTPEALQQKIQDYFDNGVKIRRGIPIPTMTGMVLYCGFADRQSFHDYEKKPKFAYTIKRARTFVEQEYEEQVSMGSTAAIFMLKNFGWDDKQEIITSSKSKPQDLSGLSDEDLEDLERIHKKIN